MLEWTSAPAVLDPQLGDWTPADQSSGWKSSNEGRPWLWEGMDGQFEGQKLAVGWAINLCVEWQAFYW